MSLKKDKEKVFGGEFTEESMRFFLESKSYDGTDADYVSVMKAYQHMTPEIFAQFVEFFKEEGYNVNAKNLEGESALAVIASHELGKPYVEALKAAGAE